MKPTDAKHSEPNEYSRMVQAYDAAIAERDALKLLLVEQTKLVNALAAALTPEHVAECVNSLVHFQHDVRDALK